MNKWIALLLLITAVRAASRCIFAQYPEYLLIDVNVSFTSAITQCAAIPGYQLVDVTSQNEAAVAAFVFNCGSLLGWAYSYNGIGGCIQINADIDGTLDFVTQIGQDCGNPTRFTAPICQLRVNVTDVIVSTTTLTSSFTSTSTILEVDTMAQTVEETSTATDYAQVLIATSVTIPTSTRTTSFTTTSTTLIQVLSTLTITESETTYTTTFTSTSTSVFTSIVSTQSVVSTTTQQVTWVVHTTSTSVSTVRVPRTTSVTSIISTTAIVGVTATSTLTIVVSTQTSEETEVDTETITEETFTITRTTTESVTVTSFWTTMSVTVTFTHDATTSVPGVSTLTQTSNVDVTVTEEVSSTETITEETTVTSTVLTTTFVTVTTTPVFKNLLLKQLGKNMEKGIWIEKGQKKTPVKGLEQVTYCQFSHRGVVLLDGTFLYADAESSCQQVGTGYHLLDYSTEDLNLANAVANVLGECGHSVGQFFVRSFNGVSNPAPHCIYVDLNYYSMEQVYFMNGVCTTEQRVLCRSMPQMTTTTGTVHWSISTSTISTTSTQVTSTTLIVPIVTVETEYIPETTITTTTTTFTTSYTFTVVTF